jgi:hypothetical protein
MAAQKSSPRRALTSWSIRALLVLCFAASSGCAGSPRGIAGQAPQLILPAEIETSPCLRGLLPLADEPVSVGMIGAGWHQSEVTGVCEYVRAESAVSAVKDFNASLRRLWENARK